MTVESLPPGLEVVRNAFDPVLARDLAAELAELAEPPLENQKHHSVQQVSYPTDYFRIVSHPALSTVLQRLEVPPMDGIVVNKQLPHAQQGFHTDGSRVEMPVYMFYPQGEGALDHAFGASTKEEAEEQATPLHLNARDMAILTNPVLPHRGRNTGDTTRYTVATYKHRR